MTRRRAVLATLGSVAAGGCAGLSPNEQSEHVATFRHQRTNSEKFRVTVDIDHRRITTEQTAVVSLSFTNPSDEPRDLSLPRDREGVKPQYSGQPSDHTGLLLLPFADRNRVERADDSCWTVTEEPGELLGAPSPATLDSGETLSYLFEVWWTPRAEGCLEPGSYVIEDSKNKQPEWSVTFRVESPAD